MKEETRNKNAVSRIAFFGSPAFSAALLEEILTQAKDEIQVCLVVTQPDKPAGRGLKVTQTPVKTIAQKYCIPVYDVPINRDPKRLQAVLGAHALDSALVYAYNEIIPEDILRIPSLGFWNIHPSLLPKYRGASPISFPLVFHETVTGVSLMRMVHKMDAGPILSQKEVIIETSDTQATLQSKLSSWGFRLFVETLRTAKTRRSALIFRQQNETDATYTFKLKREDGYIGLADLKMLLAGKCIDSRVVGLHERYAKKNPSKAFVKKLWINDLFDMWRGLNPWPGVWTLIPTKDGEKRLKIITMMLEDKTASIDKVQLESKSVVPFEVFSKAYPHVLS